jgi:hypothetical protein
VNARGADVTTESGNNKAMTTALAIAHCVDVDPSLTGVLPDLLRKLTYKPGWRFWLRRVDWMLSSNTLLFEIRFQAQNSNNPEESLKFAREIVIPEHWLEFYSGDEQFWRHWLRAQIMDAEMHELDEWLRIDGIMMNNPHDEVRGI